MRTLDWLDEARPVESPAAYVRGVVDRRGESFKLYRVSRYRLYPTKKQERALLEQLEWCRRLYNKALWWRQGAYKREGIGVGHREQTLALKYLKRDTPEYRGIPDAVLEDVLKRVDRAFVAFFRRVKRGEDAGYPRAKGPGQYRSMTVKRSREFDVVGEGSGRYQRLSFKGISGLRVRMHRPLPEGAAIRRAIVKREASGHWYVCFGWDVEGYEATEHPRPESSVALHPGLVDYVTTDAGQTLRPHHAFERGRRMLAKRQKKLSRKKRGSKRRERARKLVTKQHQKIRNVRHDFQHKVSRELVDSYGLVFGNETNIKSLLDDNPLKRLNVRVADAAWGAFMRKIRYKAESAGTVYVAVDAQDTARECSSCGAMVDKRPIARTHECPRCGLRVPRGVNAARNVKKRAARALRGGA